MSDTTEVPEAAFFVSCDLCVEVKTRALKTCLKCEISMCAQHLEPHLTTPVLLQTHPLSNPGQPTSTSQMSKCSTHGKLVEYYCLDDCVLVCMSCAIEEGHRLHKMKTLQSAHVELVDQLKKELGTLYQRQKQVKELEMWYKYQVQTLNGCVSEVTKTGLALKDLVFTSLQTSVSSRLGALQKAKDTINSVLKEDQDFNFLQKFASVHKAIEKARIVDLKQGLDSVHDRTKLIEEIRKEGQIIEEQWHKLWRRFLAFADPEYHLYIQVEPNSVSELKFDPQTLGPGMTLSKDHKTVFCNLPMANPSTGYRASYRTQTVRCTQTRHSGILRWFLRLSEYYDWTIGICGADARDGNYSEVYGLKKLNNTLLSLQTNFYATNGGTQKYIENLQVSAEFHVTGPWKVEVIWDCTAHLLALYSRNKPTKGLLLCKLKAAYGYNLCPFITPENKTTQQNMQPYYSQQPYNPFIEIMCLLKQ